MSVFSPPKPVIQFPYDSPNGTYANVNENYRTVNFNWDGGRGCDFQIPRLNGRITYATLNQIQAWIGSDQFTASVVSAVLIQIRKGADAATQAASSPTTQGRGTLVYQSGVMTIVAGTGTAIVERATSTVTVSSEEKISMWIRNNAAVSSNDEFGIMSSWNLIDNS